MKNMLLGVLLGAALTGAAGVPVIQHFKQAEYDRGYARGMQEGTATGLADGINRGEAEALSAIKQQQAIDAATRLRAQKERARKAAAAARRQAPKPVQNWHVIDNKIAEPIPDERPL